MTNDRYFAVTSFGDRREQAERMYANIKLYSDMPVHWWCDDFMGDWLTDHGLGIIHRVPQRDIRWKEHKRYGVRMSNWAKYAAVSEAADGDLVCVLDDDMRIVHPGFLDGFDLAAVHHICLPMNPRAYVYCNAACEDAHAGDAGGLPRHMPAVNVSPMFVRAGLLSWTLLAYYGRILEKNVMRGTLAMSRAMAECGDTCTPLLLPEQWCVGRRNAQMLMAYDYKFKGRHHPIEPLCLHWGQPEVRHAWAARQGGGA